MRMQRFFFAAAWTIASYCFVAGYGDTIGVFVMQIIQGMHRGGRTDWVATEGRENHSYGELCT